MKNLDGFSKSSIEDVNRMLFAEGEPDPLEGQCNQKQKRQQNKQQRTPAQQQADKARGQANQGKDNIPSATRSEAAKKAAETRRHCKGTPSPATLATPPTPSTTA
jgi:hypothetical protein